MTIESSSSTSISTQSSNSTNPSPQETYLKHVAPKPQTVAQIRAEGDVKTKMGILWFVGVVTTALIIIGGVSLIKDPKSAKDVWVIIGPIISSAITGTVAYFTGEKQGEKR